MPGSPVPLGTAPLNPLIPAVPLRPHLNLPSGNTRISSTRTTPECPLRRFLVEFSDIIYTSVTGLLEIQSDLVIDDNHIHRGALCRESLEENRPARD